MLRFTRHGTWEIIIGTVILLVLGGLLSLIHWSVGLLVLPILVWLFAFFRDPERPLPAEQYAMVSPADGKVSDVTELPHHDLIGGPCMRVGIFLSVFNVHVNRSPCDGKVTNVIYTKGKFMNAMSHSAASEQNESNTIVLSDPQGERVVAVVKQIVGLIARRIVCVPRIGDQLKRGERFGMIKFGSRTELYIPMWLGPQVQVKVGQTVHGTADVIAILKTPVETTAT